MHLTTLFTAASRKTVEEQVHEEMKTKSGKQKHSNRRVNPQSSAYKVSEEGLSSSLILSLLEAHDLAFWFSGFKPYFQVDVGW